jgi:hypothetical protein
MTHTQSPFAKLVPHTSGFNDTVPGWGTGRLIALLSAAIISKENATVPPDVLTPNPTPYTQLVLKSRSTVDLTDQVSSHGQIAMDPTSLFEGAETWIFAFYERKSLRRNVVFPNNASSSIWDHGSYTVDHLSAKGARTTIRFWEDYMLYEGLTDLLREAGQYGM